MRRCSIIERGTGRAPIVQSHRSMRNRQDDLERDQDDDGDLEGLHPRLPACWTRRS